MPEDEIYGKVKQRIRVECVQALIIFIDQHYDPLVTKKHDLETDADLAELGLTVHCLFTPDSDNTYSEIATIAIKAKKSRLKASARLP